MYFDAIFDVLPFLICVFFRDAIPTILCAPSLSTAIARSHRKERQKWGKLRVIHAVPHRIASTRYTIRLQASSAFLPYMKTMLISGGPTRYNNDGQKKTHLRIASVTSGFGFLFGFLPPRLNLPPPMRQGCVEWNCLSLSLSLSLSLWGSSLPSVIIDGDNRGETGVPALHLFFGSDCYPPCVPLDFISASFARCCGCCCCCCCRCSRQYIWR